MKRFYNFLSLILLSIAGITTAVAQDVTVGAQLETVDEILAEDNVLIYSESSYYATGYLQGTGSFYTSDNGAVTASCVWKLVATGETVDGHNVYYLQQKSSGKYIADYELTGEYEDSSDNPPTAGGDPTELTEDVTKALQVVIALAQSTDETDLRTYAKNGNNNEQNIGELAHFVISRKDKVKEGTTMQYFGHLYKAFHSIYQDTNAWEFFACTSISGYDKVVAYLTTYGLLSSTPEELYSAGTAPGQYKAELVAALTAAYNVAMELYNAGECTDDAADKACADLKAAYEALQATDAKNGLAEGYYFVKGINGRYLGSGTTSDGHEVVYASANGYKVSSPYVTADVKNIWHVTPSADGTTATFENVGTGSSMTGAVIAVAGMSEDGYAHALGETAGNIIITQTDKGFTLASPNKSGGNSQSGFHIKYAGQPVMCWNNSVENNTVVFETANTEGIDELVAKAKQEQLNNTLTTDVANAKTLAEDGAEGSLNLAGENFTSGSPLVSASESNSNANWFCNSPSASDGQGYIALTDGDFSTYFHTDWAAGSFVASLETNHYLVATLNKAVEAPGVVLKIAKRTTGNDYPTQFMFYGTNEFDKDNPDDSDWTELDSCNVVWGATANTKGVGYASAKIASGESYKYIKLAAIKTEYNANNTANTRGYWTISEAQLWQASISADNADSLVVTMTASDAWKAVPADVRAALNTAIANAEAALADSAATQTLIDELAAAVEAYENSLPDPTRVTKAAQAARTFLATAKESGLVGTGLAQYSQESATALEAVIAEADAFTSVVLADIDAMVEKINAALEGFKNSLIVPEAGKYYYIRSISKKWQKADGVLNYHAIVRSDNNGTKQGSVKMTPQQGAYDYIANLGSDAAGSGTLSAEDITNMGDSIQALDDNRTMWYIEKSGNGKVVMKNVGTGMYLAPANAICGQSTEPVEITLIGLAAATNDNDASFLIEAGMSGATTYYMNAQASTQRVVTWSDKTDENGKWTFEEIKDAIDDCIVRCLPVAGPGAATIVTLSTDATPATGVEAVYTIVGKTDDNKIALAEVDALEAGVPYVLTASDEAEELIAGNGEYSVTFELESGDITTLTYVYEPLAGANGLVGTICENDTIGSGNAYFNNGAIAQSSDEGTTVIGANAGYIDGKTLTTGATLEADQDYIDLGSLVIDGIHTAKAVVLPSTVNVYTIGGALLRNNVKSANAAKGLPAGVYVIGGQKVIVK